MSKRKYRKTKGNNAFFLLLAFFFFSLVLVNKVKLEKSPEKEELVPLLHNLNGYTILVPLVLLILYFSWKPIVNKIRKVRRKKQLRISGIYKIDRMTGKEFEAYLTVFFEDLNYKVQDTGGKGDRGADKILIDPSSGTRICVQAKCWSTNVTFDAVQQIYTAKTLWNCDKAWIITNRGFTKQVKETAEQLGIELWDREKLIDNMYLYNKSKDSIREREDRVFYSSEGSFVFHDLDCEHGRRIADKAGTIKFEGFRAAAASGRRKCNCYK
ncbi:restriction endonuclease [Paenibacillus chitinolyticus]|uniref:restriction endonuclease n=1 Tax=Paenibacillus chitinolyticus TaxID=79263 RepID=UPI001C488AB6|nr:restriction endonuclease [Paenibacillus chitinolyticus]MBV6717255.1 restriction endonuclease [Paenibacillus chitinolyticus]